MRYVCTECGKILTDDEAILDPDGDVECAPCYEDHKDNWFDEPEAEEPEEPEIPPQLDYNGKSIKKSWWERWFA
jgi:hypothetical protein